MKKVGIVLSVILVLVAGFVFVNKLYYPALPIENRSAKEVIEKLEASDRKVVEIAEEDETVWYITRTENEGKLKADENIKQMVEANGWEFKEKDGAGLFFEKNGERLIVTTQMWTNKYVFVKVPSKYKDRKGI